MYYKDKILYKCFIFSFVNKGKQNEKILQRHKYQVKILCIYKMIIIHILKNASINIKNYRRFIRDKFNMKKMIYKTFWNSKLKYHSKKVLEKKS